MGERIQSIEIRTGKWLLRGGLSPVSRLYEGFLMDRGDYSLVESFEEATLEGLMARMEQAAEGRIDLDIP